MEWPHLYDGAGKSALREHRRLARAWRRRRFGGWMRLVYPSIFVLMVLATFLSGVWKTTGLALVTGMWVGWWVIRNRPPDHIARWERGAWGEQLTAVDLKPLKKEGWVVRHDLDTGFGNRDHVLAGPAVYLLDTKHHIDDRLSLEGAALRVQRVDQPRDSYLLDRITPAMQRAARKLSAEIFRDTGERVWVYPVVVLWGYFEDGVSEADGVFYVDGEKLTAWLRNRPVDLYNRRREVIENWLRHWNPPASGNA